MNHLGIEEDELSEMEGGFMTAAAELLHSLVPISQFNKGQAAKIDNV